MPHGVWGTGKALVAGACRGERPERQATVWNLKFVLCGIEVTQLTVLNWKCSDLIYILESRLGLLCRD